MMKFYIEYCFKIVWIFIFVISPGANFGGRLVSIPLSLSSRGIAWRLMVLAIESSHASIAVVNKSVLSCDSAYAPVPS